MGFLSRGLKFALVLTLSCLFAFWIGYEFHSLKVTPQAVPYSALEEENEAIRLYRETGGLVLPKEFFVVPGRATRIFLRSIVPIKDVEVFRYSIRSESSFVKLERRFISIDAPSSAKGEFALTVSVSTVGERVLEERTVHVHFVSPSAGEGMHFNMLMVGDSLGHQSRFPNVFAELLRTKGNPTVEFIGTFQPPGSTILHEHYGGWRFKYFTSVFGVDPKAYWRDRSPFVFKNSKGNVEFSPERYFNETLHGAKPRNIHIQLGINDAFTLDPQSKDLSSQLDDILRDADLLISGFKRAIPNVIISVGTVIPANVSDRAFIESYPDYPIYHSEWRWRQLQMRLVRKMLDHFEAQSSHQILMVPTHAVVDSLDGYLAHPGVPEGAGYVLSNAVHPSQVGDAQIASAIYAVVKAELDGQIRLK